MSFFKKITQELENLGIGGDKDKKKEETKEETPAPAQSSDSEYIHLSPPTKHPHLTC